MIRFNKSIQTRYWVSLLVFLIPVVAFGIFIYIYNIDSNKKFISATRLASFEKATSQMEYVLEHLKSMTIEVSANQERYLSADDSGYVDESAIISKLNYIDENSSIDIEPLFYIRGEKYIYSSSKKYLYSHFERQYNMYDISRSRLFTKLNTTVAPIIYQFYFSNDSINAEGMIAYICPLEIKNRYPSAFIVFLIRESVLREKFNDFLGNSKGDLYVYNNKLDIVLSPEKDIKDPKFTEIFKIKGIGQISLPESKNIALRQIINGNELTAITVMPEKEYFKELIPSKRILIILIFLLILCCIILAFSVVKRTYQPIRSLVKDIVDPNLINNKYDCDNEIDLIKNTFKQSKERTQSLMQQLANQNTIIANQFVLRLTTGKFKNMEDFNYNATCIGFAHNKKYWVVMHLSFFNKSTWRKNVDQGLEISKDFSISGTTILFAEQFLQPTICYVIHFDCEDTKLAEFCSSTAEKLRKFLLINNIHDFIIGVGSPCTDPFTVKKSFFEAGAAIQLTVPSSREIYFYNPSENLEHDNYMLPAMEKSLLMEGIRHGDDDTALTALDRIIKHIRMSNHSYVLVRLLCSELLNTLLNLAKENDILLEQNDLENLVIFNETSDLYESTIEITTSLCSQIHVKLDLDSALKKQDVLTFIKENFTREDFSLDYIADSLNLTKAKISSIIKEDIGCGFSQYIAILRIDEVKRQLIESTKPIQEIIRDVGYLDVSNFIRKFKTTEGVTPGQFRTLYGKCAFRSKKRNR